MKKAFLLFLLPIILIISVSCSDQKSSNTDTSTPQITEEPQTIYAIDDFITADEINSILGEKPPRYVDYHKSSDYAFAYFGFNEVNDGTGMTLNFTVRIGENSVNQAYNLFPLVENPDAARSEIEELTILGEKAYFRTTYYIDYEGDKQIERLRDYTLSCIKADNLYHITLSVIKNPEHKNNLPTLMERFMKNVQEKVR